MAMIVPLPKSVRDLLRENTHLGLQLDKYVESWDEELFSKPGDDTGKLSERVQKPTVELIASKSRTEPPGLNYADLFARWQAVASARGAMAFKAKTVGPLTLHLARASALENAGICLHPIYGFVYLPGTGLKGMARAFAETVWLPAQTDQKKAWQQIEDVFGWAPNPDRVKQIRDPNHPAEVRYDPNEPRKEITASSGQIIFLDAWPTQWTPLIGNILNNHHASYYQDQEPPGDWDSPVPVYFLAVPQGQTFCFALAKRRADVPDELLQLVTEWLVGALEYEGAGAKTASGYGSFKLTETPKLLSRENLEKTWKGALAKQKRAEFACTLELVTPAFLAGPWQKEEDCELRPATLRGMLRWWWRTMHAGHVDAKTLARLEAAVWGDTNACGAVRVVVEPETAVQPILYDKQKVVEQNGLPQAPNKRTTIGLYYFTFGMDDFRNEEGRRFRYQRFYLKPGTKWRIGVIVRSGVYEVKDAKGKVTVAIKLSPTDILPQAQAALWLLCRYGGVGSKSRKGYGCFDVPAEIQGWTLDKCKEVAREFRNKCNVSAQKGCDSPTLETMLAEKELLVDWKNVWWVLDRIGAAAQAFAQSYAKNPQKLALGLPRKVRGPFQLGTHVRGTDRHASPVIFHVGRQHGKLFVQCVAFPSPELPADPTRKKSESFLKQAIGKITAQLEQHFKQQQSAAKQDARFPSSGRQSPSTPQGARSSSPPAAPVKNGDIVEVTIVEDPKGKGRLYGKHEPNGLVGPILDPQNVIKERSLGAKVALAVHSVNFNQKQIQFKPIQNVPKK